MEDRACWGRINGWKQEEEKEDMGYGTRECFHLKEELRKNITPQGDKGQEERGKREENGGGATATIIYGWSSMKVEAC